MLVLKNESNVVAYLFLAQLLTVAHWATLQMGWCLSLLQHTIQWPRTPAILAIL